MRVRFGLALLATVSGCGSLLGFSEDDPPLPPPAVPPPTNTADASGDAGAPADGAAPDRSDEDAASPIPTGPGPNWSCTDTPTTEETADLCAARIKELCTVPSSPPSGRCTIGQAPRQVCSSCVGSAFTLSSCVCR